MKQKMKEMLEVVGSIDELLEIMADEYGFGPENNDSREYEHVANKLNTLHGMIMAHVKE